MDTTLEETLNKMSGITHKQKQEELEVTKNQALMDNIIRLTAIENLLINKNIISKEEYADELIRITKLIQEAMLGQ